MDGQAQHHCTDMEGVCGHTELSQQDDRGQTTGKEVTQVQGSEPDSVAHELSDTKHLPSLLSGPSGQWGGAHNTAHGPWEGQVRHRGVGWRLARGRQPISVKNKGTEVQRHQATLPRPHRDLDWLWFPQGSGSESQDQDLPRPRRAVPGSLAEAPPPGAAGRLGRRLRVLNLSQTAGCQLCLAVYF